MRNTNADLPPGLGLAVALHLLKQKFASELPTVAI